MNTLGTAIIKTLAYFDVFQTPLTSEEVHSLLWKETAPFSQVKAGLDMLVEESKIEIKEGIYLNLGSIENLSWM